MFAGPAVRKVRRGAGMTQAAMAEALDISPSYLNLIEHNRRRVGEALLTALAGALGVAETALTEGAESAVMEGLRAAAAGRAAAIGMTPAGFATGATADVLHVDRVAEPARMIVVGAMEFSAALSAAAHAVGFRVTVVDPRELFTTPERFPGADLVVAWPPDYLATTAIDDRTVVCHLGHDDRYDADLLAVALASPAGYVGAMGSRRTTEKRRAALEARGVDTARLHAPIGLDLGASTPEETAVAILAEVIATRTGRLADPLRATAGTIRPA